MSEIPCIVFCLALTLAWPCHAQAPQAATPSISSQRELVVGTKQAPPFAMKGPSGAWSGIGIDLWRRVADELHLRYRFREEPNVQALIDGVANGQLDVAVAALTVTAARERVLDFTEPYYVTGLGIAVPVAGEPSWIPVVRTMTSFGFAQAIATLSGLALAVGLLVWFFERRHNEQFGGDLKKGLSAGVMWSTVAMTQRHSGDISPQTLLGRMVAIVWMIGSIAAIAMFTASITSLMTIRHLQGTVHGVNDLSSARIGAVVGTSTEDALSKMRVRYSKFAAPEDGLIALRDHSLDAFVYDKPILAWIIQQHFSSSIELLDTTFERQEYAFALPTNHPLTKAINITGLDAIQSDWWEKTVVRYLGAQRLD